MVARALCSTLVAGCEGRGFREEAIGNMLFLVLYLLYTCLRVSRDQCPLPSKKGNYWVGFEKFSNAPGSIEKLFVQIKF